MWSKVRQLTGRDKSSNASSYNSVLTADQLNDHYAAVSNDANYEAPKVKSTVNHNTLMAPVTNLRLFNILDKLQPTATGLDGIPAWFLKIGAPFFTAPLVDMLNLSLSSSVVPQQWKLVKILPLPKVSTPLVPADFRPISKTPVLSRVLERLVSPITFTHHFSLRHLGLISLTSLLFSLLRLQLRQSSTFFTTSQTYSLAILTS